MVQGKDFPTVIAALREGRLPQQVVISPSLRVCKEMLGDYYALGGAMRAE